MTDPAAQTGLMPRMRGTASAFVRSTRLRLAAALVAVVAVAGLLIVTGVRTLLLDQLDARVNDALVQESQEFRRFLELGRTPEGDRVDGNLREAARLFLQRSVLKRDEVVVVVDDRRGVVQSLPPDDLVRLGDDDELLRRLADQPRIEIQRLRTAAGPASVLAVPVLREGRREGVFIVAEFTRAQRAEVDDALAVVIWFTAGAVLLTALTSWWIAGRVLRPLRTAADTARSINDRDLSLRLDDPGGRDEIAVLVRTFNGLLDRLEGAMEAQRVFLADTSHDLRTPLTVLGGNLEQLRSGLVPREERDEVLGMLHEEVGRMSRLVDDLVLLARAQRPDFLRVGPVDLGDLTLAVVRRAQAMRGPEWRARPGQGVITADAERLTQALLNLAANAARYSPAGEPVHIGTRLEDGRALLWVADSGPGIPAADRTRIFERHERGRDRARTGSGLGLAITRAIAEAHGGTVELMPANGRGAHFVITIPADGPPGEGSDT